uniref:Acid-sensing ion channel 1 n=1 Tax=Leptobrachium leishanense TaxID=445787 RepID=A0A8C5QHF3_9ANUR
MDTFKPTQEEDDESPSKASDLTVFASNSTLHGISHIFLHGGVTPRRVFWACAFVASLSIFLYQVADRIIYYTEYHHVTTLDEMESSLMIFPAITICNYNSFRKSAVKLNDLLWMKKLFNITEENFPQAREAFNLPEDADFNNIQMSFDMKEFYDRAGHRMEDMILKCRYRNKPCGAENFTEVSGAKQQTHVCGTHVCVSSSPTLNTA